MSTVISTSQDVEPKFDCVVIDYEPEAKSLNRRSWEDLDIEVQRELLAYGKVRFFKEEEEIPFYKALL